MFKELIANLVAVTCESLHFSYPDGVIISEPPAHIPGDYSVNIALQLARETGKPPREIAESIATVLRASKEVAGVDLAGPGFLNITLSAHAYEEALHRLFAQPHVLHFVLLPEKERQRINVEYISANPSGPLTVGNARGGPIGEALCRMLVAQGHDVTREFYVNDIGGQANRFGASVLHFYAAEFNQERAFPEDGYQGEYVKVLAQDIAKQSGSGVLDLPEAEQVEAIRQLAIARMVEGCKTVIARLGITFDRWFWQSTLHKDDELLKTLYALKAHDATIEKDGATWLKAGLRDDDRETVLVKSDGTTTYFLDDLAYHENKLVERKYDRAIVLLGADHSGHPPRMRSGIQAMGIVPERYQAVVYQYVQLKENGQPAEMSKRAGRFVTAAQVLDEVPKDVFTYFLVSKSNETHVDFDLQLAKDTSEKNPVYSIQYAHARIVSLLSKAGVDGIIPALPLTLIMNPSEQALLRQLSAFAEVVTEAAETYRVNLLTQYLSDLAARYHQFYAQNRVIEKTNREQTAYRLLLSHLTQKTLKAGLGLLNISAPEELSRD